MSRAVPWLCVLLHVLACAVLAFVLRDGTEQEPDLARRAAFVARHAALWRGGWGAWMLAAASLVAFYAWWGARLSSPRRAGVALAALGLLFDWAGEGLYALPLVGHAAGGDLPSFAATQRWGTLLTAGAANGLYTAGGIVLTLGTRAPRAVRGAMWATWLSGAAMTASALLGNVAGLVVSSTLLFPLMIAWILWMAVSWGG